MWTRFATDSGIRIVEYALLFIRSGRLMTITPGSSLKSARIEPGDKSHRSASVIGLKCCSMDNKEGVVFESTAAWVDEMPLVVLSVATKNGDCGARFNSFCVLVTCSRR